MKLPLNQCLIPENNFLVPLDPLQEMECYIYYDGPLMSLATDGNTKYLAIVADEVPSQRTVTTMLFPISEELIERLTNNKIYLYTFQTTCPYMLVIKQYYSDPYPVKCWKISPSLVDDREFATPGYYLSFNGIHKEEHMNLVVENIGKERASYVIGFEGHLNTETKTPVHISKRSIEVLKQMIDLGKSFGAGEKLEKGVIDRLKGFPNGEDITLYLENNGINVFDYVEKASEAFEAASKASGNTGERAKRGQGYIAKSQKFTNNSAAKLTCLLAPASKTDKVSDEQLIAGFEAAKKMMSEVTQDSIVALARKIAEKTGLDSDGRIRLRSESKEEETN